MDKVNEQTDGCQVTRDTHRLEGRQAGRQIQADKQVNRHTNEQALLASKHP